MPQPAPPAAGGSVGVARPLSSSPVLNGVIFDLDGTLGDTLPVCYASFRRVFEDYLGVRYSDAEIHAMFGPSEEGILADRLAGDGDRALERYLETYAAAHELAPAPFPGIEGLLDRLDERGVPMAVVTGKGLRSAELSLRAWGLNDRFIQVLAGGPDGNIKDGNMARVLAAWGVAPASVVSVGDAPTDVHAARSNGLIAAGAAWASTADADRLRREKPDAVFSSVAAFTDWVLSR